MADDGIKIKITPSNVTGGARDARRLTESPSSAPSFVSEKFGGGPRLTAASTAPGAGSAERELISALRANSVALRDNAAQIKAARGLRRDTLPGSPERRILQGGIDQLFQQRDALLAAGKSEVGRDIAKTEGAAAMMPGTAQRGLGNAAQSLATTARSLVGVARETWSGNPLGALQHAARGAGVFGAGRFAGGGAAEGAEAAGGSMLGPVLAVGALAAGAFGAFQLAKHPEVAEGLISAPLSIFDARRYSPEEAGRQTGAYRYAREFGESGGPLSSYTRSSRFSALGMDPQAALDVTGSMRETAGSKYVSEAQAYKGAQLGTYLGLTNEQTAQVGGAAGRLGVSPEEAIRTIASGVERGNQQGRQFEIAAASLDYLKSIAASAAVSGTAGLTAITNLSAILAKSGIPGFQGAQGVSAIAGIESTHRAGDIFGTAAAGAGFVQLGEASILQQVNTDKRFASKTPRDRLAIAEQIRQAGFSGPYGKIYGAAIHQEISTATSALGRDYGLEAFEEANNFPVGGYRDPKTGQWVNVNDSVMAMDAAFQSGDFQKASSIQSKLLASGAKNIPDATKALAEHAMARAGTGASALGTFAGIERTEAAMVRRLAIAPDTDKNVANLLNKFASAISPSSVTGPTSESATIPAGDATRIANADLSGFNLPPMLRAEMGSPATATGAGGDPGARDSTLQGVGLEIVSAINTLAALIASSTGYSVPPAGFGVPTAPVPGATRRAATGHTGSTASTPKAPRH
jgi:hypothetical protein